MLTAKITDKRKFKKISDIDFSQTSKGIYKGAFDGHISIELANGESIESTGQHGVNDWNEDYGFIVIEKDSE